MLVKNSQEDIYLNLPPYVESVILKISGGTDSALVGYLLSKYISEERPDLKVIPLTVIHGEKPFQEVFSRKVLEFLSDQFGDIFLEHLVELAPTRDDYLRVQVELLDKAYQSGNQGRRADAHANGITKNPPDAIMDSIFEQFGARGPVDNRHPGTKRGQYDDSTDRIRWQPLINLDKKGVADLYESLSLKETLLPLTRSCEDYTEDFSKHCGQCWWCAERQWGFGHL